MALTMVSMQSSANMDHSFYKLPISDQPHHAPSSSSSSSSLPLRVLEKIMSEPTIIDYGDSSTKKETPHWLSPNYIDLHLRSARLVSCEAKVALHRHFESLRERSSKKASNGQQSEIHEESVPIVWDASWEPSLAMACADVDEDRSFLDEAFC